jgi:PKD domain
MLPLRVDLTAFWNSQSHTSFLRACRGVLSSLLVAACVSDAPATGPVAEHNPPISADVANIAPTTAFAVSPRWPQPGDTVTVDGSYSHDADGAVTRYRWEFGNGAEQTTSAVARTVYRNAGTYPIRLTTYDDSGDSTSVTLSLVVNSAGAPATAISASLSTLTLASSSVAAGSGVVATLTARSSDGSVRGGVSVSMSARGRRVAIAPAVATTSAGTGVATATISSTLSQSTTIRAVADFTALTASPTLTVTPALVSATRSAMRVTQTTFASLTDSAFVEVTVRDTANNPVSGASVSIASSVTSVTLPSTGTTDANGRWVGVVKAGALCGNMTTTLTATAAGTALSGNATLLGTSPGAYTVCAPNFWIDASDASTLTTESGARVTQWRDKSGLARHVSAPSGSTQRPTVNTSSIAGRNAVSFSPASSQYLSTTTGVDARTILAVMRSSTEAAADRSVFSVRSLTTSTSCPNCSSLMLKANDGPTGNFLLYVIGTTGTSGLTLTRTQNLALLMSTVTTASSFDFAVNRGSASTTTYSFPLLPRTGTTLVGAEWWAGALQSYFSGQIGEILTFDRALTTTERNAAERALMIKWGLGTITISSGNSQTANAGTSPTNPPTARVTDASGTGLASAPVTFLVTGGNGRVNGSTTYATTTDASGFASVPAGQWVLDAGSNTIRAYYSTTAGTGSSVQFTATGSLPSGLQLRLDAADTTSLVSGSACGATIATNGQLVGCWLDRSGNAANAVQATSASRPTVSAAGINGKRAVQFTLANESWLAVTATNVRALRSAARTVIAVATAGPVEDAVTNYFSAIAVWPGFHNGMMVFDYAGGLLFQMDQWSTIAGGSVISPNLSGITSGAPFVGSNVLRFSSATSYSGEVALNGVKSPTSSVTAASSSGTTDLRIGQGNVSPATDYRGRLNGRIGELLVFDRALSDAERLQVERYLGWKWGITVP